MHRRWWVVGAALVLVAVQTAPYWWSSDAEAAAGGWLLDDAYFYAVMAGRFAESGEFAFFPGMTTNGVQPLWMALVAGLQWVAPGLAAGEILRGLSTLLFLGAAALAAAVVSRDGGRPATSVVLLFAAFFAHPGVQRWVLNGMETALTLAVVVGLLWQLCRVIDAGEEAKLYDLGFLAVLSALCFFARTDLFVVAPVVAIWLALRRGLGGEIALYCGVVAVMVLPYLVGNQVVFGSPVPLSGEAKQFYMDQFYGSLSAYLASDEWRGPFVAFAMLVPWSYEGGHPFVWGLSRLAEAMTVIVPVLAIYVAFGRRHLLGRSSLSQALQVLAVVMVLHLAVMYGYHQSLRSYTSYYFAPTVLISVLIFVVAAARYAERLMASLVARVVLALWVAALGWYSIDQWRSPEDPRWQARVELAKSLQELPDHSTVGAYWPGGIAYFSGRPVVPMDGIIASARYQEAVMKRGRAMEDLCQREDPHLVVFVDASWDYLVALEELPEITDWSWAFLKDMKRFGFDRLEVVQAMPVGDGGGGWFLVRLKDCAVSADEVRR